MNIDSKTKNLKESCSFEGINLSNTKNTVNVVKNWYSSVYFWNVAYSQANLLAAQNLDSHRTQQSRQSLSSPPRTLPTLNQRLIHNNSEERIDERQQQPNATGKLWFKNKYLCFI